MEAVRNLAVCDKKWAIADACALLVGAFTRFMLSNGPTNPILTDLERFRPVPQLSHYLFNPLTYVAVAALFAFGVIRLKCIGFWSVFFSFMVGGILATIFLSIR